MPIGEIVEVECDICGDDHVYITDIGANYQLIGCRYCVTFRIGPVGPDDLDVPVNIRWKGRWNAPPRGYIENEFESILADMSATEAIVVRRWSLWAASGGLDGVGGAE